RLGSGGRAGTLAERGPPLHQEPAAHPAQAPTLSTRISSGSMAAADVIEGYDFLVVGSGFGGSVSALRLAEKGYRVAVLEAGKRFRPEDFPKTNWDVRKFLWMPKLGCHGIQRLTLLRDVLVLSGAGVGGGSLVYANTLPVPRPDVFERPEWPRG